MGSVTEVGVLFVEPLNKPVSTTGIFQPNCYRIFYYSGTTTLAPVYRDPALKYPFNQTTNPQNTPLLCIGADMNGRFPPIWLNPNIAYRSQLYSSSGTLLEDADPVNPTAGLNNSTPAPTPIVASVFKNNITSVAETIAVVVDPELQLPLTVAGTYKIDVDLAFIAGASGATPGIVIRLVFTGTLASSNQYSNTLSAYGVTNGGVVSNTYNSGSPVAEWQVNGVGTGSGFTGSLGTAANLNTIRLSGTIQITTQGTFQIDWGPAATSTASVQLLGGSSIVATLIS